MSTPKPAAGLARGATRNINRAEVVDRNLRDAISNWSGTARARPRPDQPVLPGAALLARDFMELLESQFTSRVLDLEARAMRARGEGFYTIGSSGHEANALVARLTRHTDMAFLHYRSGGFMMERARKLPGIDPVYDTALSFSASAEDPISGGRHKVWGSKPLNVPPQTSTIASHLPKAVGAAIAIAQAKRLGVDSGVPDDAITLCSFGDASANHSTATGAINAACWTAYQKLPCPVLFVCEDNGIGISVRTPGGWIAANYADRAGMDYVYADGTDLLKAHDAIAAAVAHCRTSRRPTFLHIAVTRLMGHAGTDTETEYRSVEDLEAHEARDPLLRTASIALESGLYTSAELLALYEGTFTRVREASARAAQRPKLTTREAVMAPLAPLHADDVMREATRVAAESDRVRTFGAADQLPESQAPRHLSIQINRALHDLMAKYPGMTLFGEDVAQKGGVYTVTSGLYGRFGGQRVFNTLLDEQTILGLAQGAAHMGLLPCPEIQYLAYYHNACDQIRGEAASLSFFSNGQFRNGMVMRVAGLAYQKGFGGHFHNDNSFTALRDIPGLIIACPSRGDDAALMLRTLMAAAKVDGRVSAFLEPIALYMTKDLHEPKDNGWLFPYPAPDQAIPFGEGRVYHADAKDLLIITYGNGVHMSLRVAKRIESATGKRTRVLDLRWLKPLNAELIAQHARDCGTVLVVDEGRKTGGLAEEIFTALDEHAPTSVRKARVAGADCYVPLADAANLVLVQEAEIEAAAKALLGV
jgi:2-oxoisovalerate dehydrogenase E1 component